MNLDIYYEPYEEKDKLEILNILQQCLSPSLSLEWFNWKHEDNYYGKSIGWVAKDIDGIIGCLFVRRLEIISNGKVSKAMRLADVAILPRGRRRGVFTNLILKAQGLVDNSSDISVLLTTANIKSKFGFIKLRWNAAIPALAYKMYLVPLWGWEKISYLVDESLLAFDNYNSVGKTSVNKIPSYLKWRYSSKSGTNYNICSLSHSINKNCCIYKVEQRRFVKYIIILELVGSEVDKRKLLRSMCKKENTFLVISLMGRDTPGIPLPIKKGKYEFFYYMPGKSLDWDITLGDLDAKL